jgi:hypothetical protein
LGRPEYGKVYALTSADRPCIAHGNTWVESEVKQADIKTKRKRSRPCLICGQPTTARDGMHARCNMTDERVGR